MIALLQRVSQASVSVEGMSKCAIAEGMTILLGVLKGDEVPDVKKLVDKIVNLRIFADEAGKMNLSLLDIGGSMLVVSQFTLAANVKRGRRPSFDEAALPDEAKKLYELFIARSSEQVSVQSGEFGANMKVEIHNDGPVTIIIDSSQL